MEQECLVGRLPSLPLFRTHSRQRQPIINDFLPESHAILLQSYIEPLLINQGWSNTEFSFSIWSLPSRNLRSHFDSKTKRETSMKMLLQRHILCAWRRLVTGPFKSVSTCLIPVSWDPRTEWLPFPMWLSVEVLSLTPCSQPCTQSEVKARTSKSLNNGCSINAIFFLSSHIS